MSDDALIHLRVSAGLKARWVRESRAAGEKLTDWIVNKVDYQLSVAAAVSEVGYIAEQIVEMPIYWRSEGAREGAEAMLQAAEAFRRAEDASGRIDAALWLSEAYLIFSRSLPDTGIDERDSAWATARQIAAMIGGPLAWEERVRESCK